MRTDRHSFAAVDQVLPSQPITLAQQPSASCNRWVLFQQYRSQVAANACVQLCADAALSWPNSAMLYRSKQKPLIDPVISRRVKVGVLPGDSPVWDPRSFRLRNFLAIVFAAVLIAAILRHVLHVYGGIPREEIRVDAFIAILIVAAVTVFFQRVSRRR
jgi:hypothetical protein